MIQGLIPLRRIIPAIVILAGWAMPATAQIWVDAAQLGDRVPDWVDPKYYHPTPAPPPVRAIWVEPVYRLVSKQIWHEPVYQTISERIWVEGHYVTLPDSPSDPCDDAKLYFKRSSGRVWVPGHYVTVQRRICITPGHWDIVRFKELVTPGHWETIAYRG
jgi:hypothetical protein